LSKRNHSRKPRKKISMNLISEFLLNEEQRNKFSLNSESLTYSGHVSLFKITDQNIFDVMFVEMMIEQPQHQSAILLMEDLSQSGATIPSPSLENDGNHAPTHKSANRLAERRMAFSEPYRHVLKECGEIASQALLRCIDNAHRLPPKGPERLSLAERVAQIVKKPLESAARFYKIDRMRDPRRILASQFMSIDSVAKQRIK